MAPTIFRIWNVRVMIYPKDHAPAHVHVIGPEAEAKFDLRTMECISNTGFSPKTVKRFEKFLKERRAVLLEAWNDYQK